MSIYPTSTTATVTTSERRNDQIKRVKRRRPRPAQIARSGAAMQLDFRALVPLRGSYRVEFTG